MSKEQHNAPALTPSAAESDDSATGQSPSVAMRWDGAERAITVRDRVLVAYGYITRRWSPLRDGMRKATTQCWLRSADLPDFFFRALYAKGGIFKAIDRSASDVRKLASHPSFLSLSHVGICHFSWADLVSERGQLDPDVLNERQKSRETEPMVVRKLMESTEALRQPLGSHPSSALNQFISLIDRGQYVLFGVVPVLKPFNNCAKRQLKVIYLGVNETEDNRFFSLSFPGDLCSHSLLSTPLIFLPRKRQFVGLESKPYHGPAREHRCHHARDSNRKCTQSDGYSNEGRHDCPCVPPNHAISHARFHAGTHAVPQLFERLHSFLPLWLCCNSAMDVPYA